MELLLLLKCGTCGDVAERLVRVARVSARFAPLQCPECLAWTVEPTIRPWDITTNDRRFLRRMRIAV